MLGHEDHDSLKATKCSSWNMCLFVFFPTVFNCLSCILPNQKTELSLHWRLESFDTFQNEQKSLSDFRAVKINKQENREKRENLKGMHTWLAFIALLSHPQHEQQAVCVITSASTSFCMFSMKKGNYGAFWEEGNTI